MSKSSNFFILMSMLLIADQSLASNAKPTPAAVRGNLVEILKTNPTDEEIAHCLVEGDARQRYAQVQNYRKSGYNGTLQQYLVAQAAPVAPVKVPGPVAAKVPGAPAAKAPVAPVKVPGAVAAKVPVAPAAPVKVPGAVPAKAPVAPVAPVKVPGAVPAKAPVAPVVPVKAPGPQPQLQAPVPVPVPIPVAQQQAAQQPAPAAIVIPQAPPAPAPYNAPQVAIKVGPKKAAVAAVVPAAQPQPAAQQPAPVAVAIPQAPPAPAPYNAPQVAIKVAPKKAAAAPVVPAALQHAPAAIVIPQAPPAPAPYNAPQVAIKVAPKKAAAAPVVPVVQQQPAAQQQPVVQQQVQANQPPVAPPAPAQYVPPKVAIKVGPKKAAAAPVVPVAQQQLASQLPPIQIELDGFSDVSDDGSVDGHPPALPPFVSDGENSDGAPANNNAANKFDDPAVEFFAQRLQARRKAVYDSDDEGSDDDSYDDIHVQQPTATVQVEKREDVPTVDLLAGLQRMGNFFTGGLRKIGNLVNDPINNNNAEREPVKKYEAIDADRKNEAKGFLQAFFGNKFGSQNVAKEAQMNQGGHVEPLNEIAPKPRPHSPGDPNLDE